jgi:hypothetical protein
VVAVFRSRKKRERRERYERDEQENSLRLSEIGEAIDLKSAPTEKAVEPKGRRRQLRPKKPAK